MASKSSKSSKGKGSAKSQSRGKSASKSSKQASRTSGQKGRGSQITPTSIAPAPRGSGVRSSQVRPGSDNQAENAPQLAAAPYTAEDPSRGPSPAVRAAANKPAPKTKYHPVYGARTANDPNEEAALFQPPHNWFDTAGEADAHRTDREAQLVVQHNRQVKNDAALARHEDAEHETDRAVALGDAGIVRNSVQATESIKNGNVEPL